MLKPGLDVTAAGRSLALLYATSAAQLCWKHHDSSEASRAPALIFLLQNSSIVLYCIWGQIRTGANNSIIKAWNRIWIELNCMSLTRFIVETSWSVTFLHLWASAAHLPAGSSHQWNASSHFSPMHEDTPTPAQGSMVRTDGLVLQTLRTPTISIHHIWRLWHFLSPVCFVALIVFISTAVNALSCWKLKNCNHRESVALSYNVEWWVKGFCTIMWKFSTERRIKREKGGCRHCITD